MKYCLAVRVSTPQDPSELSSLKLRVMCKSQFLACIPLPFKSETFLCGAEIEVNELIRECEVPPGACSV
jgi:hypothetical protein